MMTEDDILSFGRFKYPLPFVGSHKGMRFKIVHPKPGEGEEDLFYIDVWPEPYCYEKTDPQLIEKTTIPFGREGYDRLIPYLNEVYERRKDEFTVKAADAIEQ